MEILDAQVLEPAPWHPWEHDAQTDLALSTELLLAHMDAAGVDGAVMLSKRTEWTMYAAHLHPDRLLATVQYDESAPDVADQVAATFERGFVGIRVLASWPPENVSRFRAGAYDQLISAAEVHHVPVSFFVSGHVRELVPVVEAHPGLEAIVDHLGLRQPPRQQPTTDPWSHLPGLVALARFPNVSVKLSGVPSLSRESYPFRDVWPYVHQVLGAFGPERVMWGSDIHRIFARVSGPEANRADEDYPGRHNYAEALGYILHSGEVSEDDKRLILGGTLRRVYRWPAPDKSSL